jgi:multidrug efflux pump subunit AcrA (membrane-fusion protein)
MSKKLWIVIGVVAVVGGGLWMARDRMPGARGAAADEGAAPAATATPTAPPEIAVTVAPITPRTVRREVRIVGTLHGFDEIEVGAKVDGRIGRILRDVGDIVRPGDVLLEIDDVDYRLAVDEMQRGLELELSRLGLKTPPDGSFDVRTLPNVARAMIVETNAASTLDRYKQLVATNAITKDDFEKAELNYQVARLDVKQRIIEAEEALASARQRAAALETARQRLRDAQVAVPPLASLAGAPREQIGLVSASAPPAGLAPAAFPGGAGGRRDGGTEGQRDVGPYGAVSPSPTLSPAPTPSALPAVTPQSMTERQRYQSTERDRETEGTSVAPPASLPPTSLRPSLPAAGAAQQAAAVVASSGIELAVAERFVSEGEMVRTMQGAKLFRLVVENPLKLQAAVPERYAGQMKPGRPVELTVEAYPGRTFSGTVARVSPTVDVANRTFLVEVAVPNDDHALKPGTFAVASVVIGEESAPTVPEEAIVRFAGVTKLFVVQGGKVQSVPVELGLRADERAAAAGDRWVEIRPASAGDRLTVGATVATSGQSQLADQTAVRVREPLAPATRNTAAVSSSGTSVRQ